MTILLAHLRDSESRRFVLSSQGRVDRYRAPVSSITTLSSRTILWFAQLLCQSRVRCPREYSSSNGIFKLSEFFRVSARFIIIGSTLLFRAIDRPPPRMFPYSGRNSFHVFYYRHCTTHLPAVRCSGKKQSSMKRAEQQTNPLRSTRGSRLHCSSSSRSLLPLCSPRTAQTGNLAEVREGEPRREATNTTSKWTNRDRKFHSWWEKKQR